MEPTQLPHPELADLTVDQLNADIRQNINTIAAHRGVRSKVDLAAASGISKSTLYDRFNGKSPDWTTADLLRIAKALGCSMSDLTADPATLLGSRIGRFRTCDDTQPELPFLNPSFAFAT